MSNTKHKDCTIRNMAKSAKKRLGANDYSCQIAPKNATVEQKSMCEKIIALKNVGEEIVNPVAQLADKDLLNSLSHEERQRYILKLCADYIAVKKFFDEKSSAS